MDNLVTYQAQKVKIKALRGNHFQLTVNVKDNVGAGYDFSNDSTNSSQYDDAYFVVVNNDSTGMLNYYTQAIEGQTGEMITFSATITEDGKIVIESTNDAGFWPQPGVYKYNLFTRRVGDNGSTTPQHLTHWLYGDFVVEKSNSNFTDEGGVISSWLTEVGGEVSGG